MERRRFGLTMPQTHMISRHAGSDVTDWFRFIVNNDVDPTTVDADADGVYPSGTYELLVDLSHALSQRLGRQMSMMSVYRVNYIRIDLVNSDDPVNDNDTGLTIGGKLSYWEPSKHRVEAMQLARATEKAAESTAIDGDSFLLSTQKDYTGMRFNWNDDGQVVFATSEAFTGLAGTEWDLQELFNTYDVMMGSGEQSNILWSAGRTGYPNQMNVAVSFNNHGVDGATTITDQTAYEWNGGQNHISVLGGLLHLDLQYSSVDDPDTSVDDDYKIAITIGVEGWRDF